MSLMGLDVGTTGAKAVAFDLEGRVLAGAYREYPEIYPRPGWVEMDPHRIWDAVMDAVKEVATKTRLDPVKAIGLSVLGEAVTPIDKAGEALYNSITSVDNRCIPQVEWWEEEVGREKIFKITGMPLHPSYSLNKIMWIKDERPKIFKKTWKFLLYEDYIVYRFGLPASIDYSLASRTMAFDIKRKKWSQEMLSKAEIDENLLAQALPSGKIVGKVADEIAHELNLPQDVLVVLGGHDQAVSALGAGVIVPGMATDTCGTVECVTACLSKPILNQKMLTNNHPVYCHVVEDMYVSLAFNYTAGALLKWYRDNFAGEEKEEAKRSGKDVYEVILEPIKDEPSPVFILPHFVGSGTPRLDPYSRGAMVGLTLSTTKRDLVKAILDSVSYELKVNLDSLNASGVVVKRLHAIGGGAKSRKWLQLKADVTGREIASLNVKEAGCLGAAILAGKAMGVFDSVKEGVARWVREKDVFHPRAAKTDLYGKRYQLYEKLYPTLTRLNRKF